jgi:hypothetical protein
MGEFLAKLVNPVGILAVTVPWLFKAKTFNQKIKMKNEKWKMKKQFFNQRSEDIDGGSPWLVCIQRWNSWPVFCVRVSGLKPAFSYSTFLSDFISSFFLSTKCNL